MLDTQLVAGGFLLAAINIAGVFVPRAYAAVPLLLGLLGWLYGLSLLPRYLRWLWKTGSEAPQPDWLVWGALGLALASFILRWWMNRQWSAEIYGKGWAWIDNWAQDKSLRARVLARKALVALGYRRARLAGDDPES
jgi:hypothetical protein